MRHFDVVRGEACGVHRKSVILGSDLNLARGQILHGVISPPMTELEFESLSSEREAQELLPQADAHHRKAITRLAAFEIFDELLQRLDAVSDGGGVPWAVRHHDPMRMKVQYGLGGGRGWHHQDLAAALRQATER